MLHKCCFWVGHTFGNYLWKQYFPKNYCVVTLIYIYIYMIIYMKMHHFDIAFGEMHELLIWKNEHLLFNF